MLGGIGATLGGLALPGLGAVLRQAGNGLYGQGPLAGILDANGNGLGGSGGDYRLSGYPVAIPKPELGGNLGLPSSAPSFANPNLGAMSALNAPNPYQDNSNTTWAPQSTNPFAPGYVAPSAPRSNTRRGSSTLAEGRAAQDYVGTMQLGNWLGMKAPSGPGVGVSRAS